MLHATAARVFPKNSLETTPVKKWADKDVRLSPDALIAEAERQVQNGALRKFRRGRGYPCFYSPIK